MIQLERSQAVVTTALKLTAALPESQLSRCRAPLATRDTVHMTLSMHCLAALGNHVQPPGIPCCKYMLAAAIQTLSTAVATSQGKASSPVLAHQVFSGDWYTLVSARCGTKDCKIWNRRLRDSAHSNVHRQQLGRCYHCTPHAPVLGTASLGHCLGASH